MPHRAGPGDLAGMDSADPPPPLLRDFAEQFGPPRLVPILDNLRRATHRLTLARAHIAGRPSANRARAGSSQNAKSNPPNQSLQHWRNGKSCKAVFLQASPSPPHEQINPRHQQRSSAADKENDAPFLALFFRLHDCAPALSEWMADHFNRLRSDAKSARNKAASLPLSVRAAAEKPHIQSLTQRHSAC
jgi:hypothetical protein